MKPSIEKIVFNIRGKKLELTSEEAKELKQILSDLFGEDAKIVHHEYISRPYPWYSWPYTTWCSGLGQAQTYAALDATSPQNIGNNASDTLYLTVN